MTPDLQSAARDEIENQFHGGIGLHLARLDGRISTMIDGTVQDGCRKLDAAAQRRSAFVAEPVDQHVVDGIAVAASLCQRAS